jgi:hypothetical protein
MTSSGMLRRVDLVRTDVSEELSASIIRLTRIGELGTTLAVNSNRRSVRRYFLEVCVPIIYLQKKISWPLVRKRNIPTERKPLNGEI